MQQQTITISTLVSSSRSQPTDKPQPRIVGATSCRLPPFLPNKLSWFTVGFCTLIVRDIPCSSPLADSERLAPAAPLCRTLVALPRLPTHSSASLLCWFYWPLVLFAFSSPDFPIISAPSKFPLASLRNLALTSAGSVKHHTTEFSRFLGLKICIDSQKLVLIN